MWFAPAVLVKDDAEQGYLNGIASALELDVQILPVPRKPVLKARLLRFTIAVRHEETKERVSLPHFICITLRKCEPPLTFYIGIGLEHLELADEESSDSVEA